MYRIVGADGQQYGPISLEQMRQWLTEGRVNAQTLVWTEGSTEWKPLANFPELAPASGPAATLPPTAPAAGLNNVDPASSVKGPAIGLLITGIINMLIAVGGIVLFAVAGISVLSELSGEEQASGMVGTIVLVGYYVVVLIVGLVILLGALKMMKLKSYGFAFTSAILAMLPCLSCCLIGLPIGIWALVVLSKSKSHFR
jgi:hypothetical protein